MIVLLHETGELELSDPDNFKAFSAVAKFDRSRFEAAAAGFGDAARFEGLEHVWISQEWLKAALQVAARPDRREAWQRMIAYASSKGWTRDAPASVRAHVEWSESRT